MTQFLKIDAKCITNNILCTYAGKTNRHTQVVKMSRKAYKLIVKHQRKPKMFYCLAHLESKPSLLKLGSQRRLYFRLYTQDVEGLVTERPQDWRWA